MSQLANPQDKFVGNIIRDEIPDNYDTYWNQITPENSGKWGSIESTRDVMNWTQLDLAYNYAQSKGFSFKQHAMVWGLQEPEWISSLTPSEQIAEIEEFYQEYAARYPNTDMIDVVNEPLHEIPSFADAIGGDGATGWDWVIWSFEKARQYMPNAVLILNDYGILGNRRNTTKYIEIINLLKDRGLIDAIGCQAHGLEYGRDGNISSSLDKLAATGLPIYISELDLDFENDNDQLVRMQSLFPLLYEHPGVYGLTFWGYEVGKHWKPDAYMLGSTSTFGNWNVSNTFQDYTTTGSGDIQVTFINDAADNDLIVDYTIIDGITYQAENMVINTGVFQDGSCGGTLSEELNCNGYIQFPNASSSITVRARGISGNEIMEVSVSDPTDERPALTWLRTDYFDGGGSMTSPSVEITSPSNGSSFLEGTSIEIVADATDSDGTIDQVEFFNGSTSIGVITTSPYTINWSVVLGGNLITAVATDNDNQSTTSAVVLITGTSDVGGNGYTYVESINTGVIGIGQGRKKATASVKIIDDLGNSVSSATVSGTFSGTFNESVSGLTGSDGTVSFESTGSKKGSVIVDFCVDNVVSAPTYDGNQNIVTCDGDSGSSRLVSRNQESKLTIDIPNHNRKILITMEIHTYATTGLLYNISGQLISQFRITDNIGELNINKTIPGVYILKIHTDRGAEVYKIFL